MTPVSFVVPALDGGPRLRRTVAALRREAAARPHEIIIVDDGSVDGSVQAVRQRHWPDVRVIAGPRRGAAAALNAGFRDARFPIVCQVDQDVTVRPGWLDALLRALDDPAVGAVQGRYVVPARARFWARVMGRDIDLRYERLAGRATDHVCTGNAAYRATAVHQTGLFDETLGYGYDNDMSYRLARAGYALAFAPDARADHYWRDSMRGYFAQQFGVGYGRLDVVRRHPRRLRGDAVSGPFMMLHAPLMLAALLLALAAAIAAALAGEAARLLLATAASIIAVLSLERSIAAIRAWRLTSDSAALTFPATHLVRDIAWAWAIVVWMFRHIAGRGSHPTHSMRRTAARVAGSEPRTDATERILVLIPAFNEAENLPLVIDDVRRDLPRASVLIINDASTDATAELLPRLGANWLTLPQRLGIGGALRAGMRYARRHGYDVVARMDGDGQHRARDLARLLRTIARGRADAALGSRYLAPPRGRHKPRVSQRALAVCLSAMTGRRVTDPTSGLWVFGRRAVRLLGSQHPDGYPEPELRLLLSRHGLVVRERPVVARERLAGRTSLTPARAAVAFARTVLALMVVPLRRTPEGASGE